MKRAASAFLAAVWGAMAGLIPNGGLEQAAENRPGWPAGWGGEPAPGISWAEEDGSHFLRLEQTEPGKLLLFYTAFEVPEGTRAVRLSWRERLAGLRIGEKPWFDAQLMFKFVGADGKDLPGPQPDPEHTWQDTGKWRPRSREFLLPEGTRALAILPALFQTGAGTFDLDDFALEAVDERPLVAARETAKRHDAEAVVAWEDPRPEAYPPMLHVDGPKLLDANGREVWFQGLGSCGLESLPDDRHIHRSILVAIGEWKANCFRLPVREDYWFGRDARQSDGGAAYRRAVDLAVNLCANRGVYIVVDLARYRAPSEAHRAFWRDVAKRYANHPAVLFDLFNEPHGISWDVWRDGGFVEDPDAEEVDESAFLSEDEKRGSRGFRSVGMKALLEAVRDAGARNVAVVAGNGWANDLSGIVDGYALDDPRGNGIVYSWHAYHWHKDWARILPVLEKHPVFLGETGAEPREEMDFIPLEWKEDPYTFVPDLLGFIQKYRIHWAGWSLHPSAAPRMVRSWDYDPTPYWGAFAKEALSGKAFPLKRMR